MTRFIYALGFSLLITASSCTKWLDKKPNKNLVIPNRLEDCQMLLDNNSVFNSGGPAIGEVGADNYYRTDAQLASYQELERNLYSWQPDIFGSRTSSDWNNQYKRIYYANSVLKILGTIEKTAGNTPRWNNVKGSAVFYRGRAHYELVKLFAKQYDPASAASDPGIPLRTDPDISLPAERGTVKGVYDHLIADLTEAFQLLPEQVDYKMQPSVGTAAALLADVYLTMGNYEKSLEFAGEALARYNNLLDFNELNPAAAAPFSRFNTEVILHELMGSYSILRDAFIDTSLYALYHDDDLRKVLFFKSITGGHAFKGSYNQNIVLFCGLTTDELYLIRAECYARKNNLAAAMDDLNTLLRTRWKTGTFTDFTATDKEDALQKILTERRKELLFRGRRWNDLRRLNLEPEFAVTLQRDLDGQVFTLPPKDPKYVYPLPLDEIQLSDLEQNPRH